MFENKVKNVQKGRGGKMKGDIKRMRGDMKRRKLKLETNVRNSSRKEVGDSAEPHCLSFEG